MRGGARAGAGRPGSSYYIWVSVGAEIETRLKEASERRRLGALESSGWAQHVLKTVSEADARARREIGATDADLVPNGRAVRKVQTARAAAWEAAVRSGRDIPKAHPRQAVRLNDKRLTAEIFASVAAAHGVTLSFARRAYTKWLKEKALIEAARRNPSGARQDDV